MVAATVPKKPRVDSMRVSAGFLDFVVDQLAGVRDLRPQPMFGGVGLYSGDLFFGIVAADVLYFKVDETTRADYEAAESKPFTPYAGRPMTMGYYSVPTSVLEDSAALAEWASRAVLVARTAGTRTTRRKERKP